LLLDNPIYKELLLLSPPSELGKKRNYSNLILANQINVNILNML